MNFEQIFELFKQATAKAFFAALLLIVSTWIGRYLHYNTVVTSFDVAIAYIPMIIFFMIVDWNKYR
jgi:hypothetical protein